MAYFRNNAVNLLNLHYGIHSLALTGTGAFYTVFLLKVGVPVPAVLASLAAILFGRFLIRPFVLPIVKRVGLKPVLIAGTIGSGLQYPFLAAVHGVGPHLYTLVAVSSVGDALYWTTYHAYFASLGDAEHRGQQIGAREAIVALIGIAAPLLAGWALVVLGPRIAFGATAIVLFCAAVPLFWTPNVRVAQEAPQAFRASLPGVLLFVADGWMACGLLFVWNLALFISLGENLQAFGGAMALAAVVGAASGLFLGRLIDSGHGARAAWIALSVHIRRRGTACGQLWRSHLCRARQCGRRVDGLPLHPDGDDGCLQSGPAFALRRALPYRDRRRMGYRRQCRAAAVVAADPFRCAARRGDPDGTGGRSCVLPVAAPLLCGECGGECAGRGQPCRQRWPSRSRFRRRAGGRGQPARRMSTRVSP